jgi:hypothetical protein
MRLYEPWKGKAAKAALEALKDVRPGLNSEAHDQSLLHCATAAGHWSVLVVVHLAIPPGPMGERIS